MSKLKIAESLQPVFEGFSKISKIEQTEYLKYFALLIERQQDRREQKRLIRFRAKLQREIKNKRKKD